MSLFDFCVGQDEPKPEGTIILDMSNLIFRALYADMNREDTSEDMFRHLAVSQVLKYRSKFSRQDYPYLVAAFDGPNLWRRKLFPQYKKNRDISLKLEKIDNQEEADLVEMQGKQVMDSFCKIRDELIENLPYPTLRVDGAEADDVIAVVAKHRKKAIIVSADKDFRQLTTIEDGFDIQLFSPAIPPQGGFFPYISKEENDRELFEKVCRGDGGDGVPSILSPDETFWPVRLRQKPVTTKKINAWWDDRHELKSLDSDTLSRFKRNLSMIDLNQIPQDIQKSIIDELEMKLKKNDIMASTKFISYMMSKGLNRLLSRANMF